MKNREARTNAVAMYLKVLMLEWADCLTVIAHVALLPNLHVLPAMRAFVAYILLRALAYSSRRSCAGLASQILSLEMLTATLGGVPIQ